MKILVHIIKTTMSQLKKLIIRMIFLGRIEIGKDAKLGKGFKTVATKMGRIKIGKSFETKRMAYLSAQEGQLSIGDSVFLNQNVSITCLLSISIGNEVLIANNVVIVDHNHNLVTGSYDVAPVKIGNKVWIGANSVILKGVTIGNNSIVAAGSVVRSNVPENSVVAGVPAKVVKWLN